MNVEFERILVTKKNLKIKREPSFYIINYLLKKKKLEIKIEKERESE
jgi:hypothetical protein